MPYLILGVGSLLISGASLIVQALDKTDEAAKETSNLAINSTVLIIAGVGAYLLLTDKIKLKG